MKFKTYLATILLTLCGTLISPAQDIQRGNQVTTEESVVDGKPYLLYYVGNNSCYVRAIEGNNYFKALAGDRVVSEDAVYYFIKDGNNWKIQSRNTGKYFPKPTRSTTFAPAEEADAGSWLLNFLSGGNISPSAINDETTYSLNRSQTSIGSVLHGWDNATEVYNQLQIYEIALSTTSIVNTGQEVSVSGTGEQTLVANENQWYVLRGNGKFFIDDSSSSFTTATAPKGFGIHNARYLVCLLNAGNGKFYVQTGYGNYLFGNSANMTTAVSATAYTESELKAIWEFHKLVDPLQPTASEVYTLNGTGAWIFVPNGFANQYYLYNISEQKFAYPTDGVWTTSEEAVPVLLESQGDSHYCIKTKDGNRTFKISDETHLTIAKSRDVTNDETTQLNTALGKLLAWGASKLSNASDITDGWYALRVHSESNHPDYAGNFIYTLPTENWAFGRPHPMSHGGEYMTHPLKDDATYFVRLWPVVRNGVTYYHWQVPTGKYVVNHNNDYPITWVRDASDFIIGKNSDGTFYIQSSGYHAQICTEEGKDDFLGRTDRKYTNSATHFDIYSVSTEGLQAWRVVFNTGADDVKLHCKRTDVKGPTDVYNNGYIFLSTGTTPGVNDFQIEGQDITADRIDTANHEIHVTYAPDVCFTADNVTVVQGSRTTGVGNTKQAILRVEVSPKAPCHPTSFTINLTGASNLSQVEAYLTTADQLHAEGVTPVLLGSQTSLSDGTVSIPVNANNTSLLLTGEHNYIWITADIRNDATIESKEVDAALICIDYVNAADYANNTTGFAGNPDGKMRIFYRQQYLWVSTDQNSDMSRFYRNPAVLSLGGGKVLAFSEYRYDDVSELGSNYDGSDDGHRIDIVMRKSTDNGVNWSAPVTVAAGTDATENTKASGYSKPAVVYTNNGKVICLMAMGSEAYDSNKGLRHIGMMTSTDGGDTWSAITDIYDRIDWGSHSPSSAYITAGRGVTFPNGRVAFLLNESRANTTDEYVIYSDNEGGTWKFAPTSSLFANSKEGKLLVMNDNSLLATVSRGTDSNLEGRGYNTTTGSASSNGISTWNASSNWGNNLSSYGCNNDILYYGRAPETPDEYEAILHTVIKGYSSDLTQELRLYISFDQASTWKEMFTILPAGAAVSSMEKLSDGNLAIFFEDGSIGGGANGSYALNGVIISKEMMVAQMENLYTAKMVTFEDGVSELDIQWEDVTSGNWAKKMITKQSTGIAGAVVSADNYVFNREGQSPRVIVIKPSGTNNTAETITITAPEGYILKSYSITGYNKTTGETFILTAKDGTSATFSGGSSNPQTLAVNNIYDQSTTFTITRTAGSGYVNIPNFSIVLAKEYSVGLHRVNESGDGDLRSYATLFVPFDLYQTDDKTKAYYITEVTSQEKILLMLTNNNGREIPNNTAVVLINSEGAPQTSFAVTSGLGVVVDKGNNLLKGTLNGTTIDLSENSSQYSLGRWREDTSADYVAGFYHTGNATFSLGANRAYLQLPTSASTRGFDFWFGDDDLTGIGKNTNRQSSNAKSLDGWYTLDGRKLSGKPSAKGIYIQGGKKVVIK